MTTIDRSRLAEQLKHEQQRFITSGDRDQYQQILRMLVNVETTALKMDWEDGRIVNR